MHKEKILVVEDEKTTWLVIQAALKKYYEVIPAVDGEQGLQMALTIKPDMIISDIMMPNMDGFTLRERLREIRELDLVPFIFLTAMESQEAKDQGLRRGADDFLTKPFESDVLLKRVHALLARSRVYREESMQQFNEQINTALFQSPPSVPGYQISYMMKPAKIGGGDIINYIHHDQQNYTFLFGDVMGKGTSAKFFAYSFIGYLRGLLLPMLITKQCTSPAEQLDSLSRLLNIDPFLQDIFISLLMAHFEFNENQFTYTNAGYMPAFFYSAAAKNLIDLTRGGGIPGFSSMTYEEETLVMAEGDVFLVLSDGVLEAKNDQAETLGEDVVKTWIKEVIELDAADIVTGLAEKTQAYMKNTLQYDDISIVAIKKIKENHHAYSQVPASGSRSAANRRGPECGQSDAVKDGIGSHSCQ
jgi:phosphoserine phosphatase RsbU/P